MFDNDAYNLMMQLNVEHQSLWRIRKHYKKEATHTKEQAFWKKLEKDKLEHIKELKVLIKRHICK
ncbi:TPA: hypothetical protein HA265_01085 [Candidatus Woesearchaeota archaeon]|nr:hypothetical protein [Candidatus Woesearchaeota archaeon]